MDILFGILSRGIQIIGVETLLREEFEFLFHYYPAPKLGLDFALTSKEQGKRK